MRFPDSRVPGFRLFLPSELNFNFVLYLFPRFVLPGRCRRDLFARLTDGGLRRRSQFTWRRCFFCPSASPPSRGNPPIFNFTVSRAETAKYREKSAGRKVLSHDHRRDGKGELCRVPVGFMRKGCRCSGARVLFLFPYPSLHPAREPAL